MLFGIDIFEYDKSLVIISGFGFKARVSFNLERDSLLEDEFNLLSISGFVFIWTFSFKGKFLLERDLECDLDFESDLK